MFQSNIEVIYPWSANDQLTVVDPNCISGDTVGAEAEPASGKEIVLRDYQLAAFNAAMADLRSVRSSLIVLATGLGKTILFSKIIQQWRGRVLVLVHLEELLQNAYQEIEAVTGEILGIERGGERHLGERIVVGTIQTVSLRLDKFRHDYFSLIIIDEAHHAASGAYRGLLDHFREAKVIGLTATDARPDGGRLPFDKCSYRMGIREGVQEGYLVPILGRRILIDSVDLRRVKVSGEDLNDAELDEEMLKGASAIADVIHADYAFDKGILFFPGCASAKLTSELINRRMPGSCVYIDGRITGAERRSLVLRLRNGESNWLCNVGIATEGFNWPEAAIIGMACPTLSRSAYVQRAGRGTRPLAGLLNGIQGPEQRTTIISESSKPYMTILDFVGISANLNLITHESFLESSDEQAKEEAVPRKRRETEAQEEPTEEAKPRVELGINFGRVASGLQSKTVHVVEEFDPFQDSGLEGQAVDVRNRVNSRDTLQTPMREHRSPGVAAGNSLGIDDGLLTEKQFKLLSKYGLSCLESLKRTQANVLVKFIAGRNWRLTQGDKALLWQIRAGLDSADVQAG